MDCFCLFCYCCCGVVTLFQGYIDTLYVIVKRQQRDGRERERERARNTRIKTDRDLINSDCVKGSRGNDVIPGCS